MDFLKYLALDSVEEKLTKMKRRQFSWVQMQVFKNIQWEQIVLEKIEVWRIGSMTTQIMQKMFHFLSLEADLMPGCQWLWPQCSRMTPCELLHACKFIMEIVCKY